MSRFIDLSGQRFGRLIIKRRIKRIGKGVRWICRCDCGNSHEIATEGLRHSGTTSCGCQTLEKQKLIRKTHGFSKIGSPSYIAWKSARQRCNYPKHKDYYRYGGRGIKFLFPDFQTWFAEVGERPSKKYSIDRIRSNGHYEPGNIRWATGREQRLNQERMLNG